MKIAIWQAKSTPGDVNENVARLSWAAQQAAQAGAELLITPEMFITGYNVGGALAALTQQVSNAVLGAVACQHGIALVVGGPVKSAAGIFNAATFFAADGAVLECYHKTHLFGALDRAMFIPGAQRPRVFDYRGVRFAMLICYDVEFPETVRACAQAGADVVLVPTAQMQPFSHVNTHVIPARAWENQVYVAYVNQHGHEGELAYVGQSVLAAPDGSCLLTAPVDAEALLFAELAPQTVAAARLSNPYLADLRQDLYG